MTTTLDRYYLQSDPEVIVHVEVPSLVTLWAIDSVDMEDESFECSRVYITINEENKCRLWKGTPLIFGMFHRIPLEAGDSIWACTRDQALVGIQIESLH